MTGVAVHAGHPALTIPSSTRGARTVVLFRDTPLRLDCGAEVRSVRVAFRTWGELNARRDNAVLVAHALTGDSNADLWWSSFFGESRVLDPSSRFVVCANVIGGCSGSSSQAELGGHPLTIFDMARVLAALLGHLGIDRTDVIGGSMGGMTTLALVARHPELVRRAVVVGAPQRQSAWALGWNTAARAAMALDPERGLEVARMFAMLSYRSPVSLELTQSGPSRRDPRVRAIQSYLHHQGRKLCRRFTPESYLTLTSAMDAFEVDDATLRDNTVPTLVVGISSDELYPAAEVRLLAHKLREATYWELQSPHGHDAFLVDAEALERRARSFLALD